MKGKREGSKGRKKRQGIHKTKHNSIITTRGNERVKGNVKGLKMGNNI